jgi:sugar O-acyltransferase (sialic acid O-acetyltransferase NeuD family)
MLAASPDSHPVPHESAEIPKRKKLWIVGAGGYGREVYWMTLSAYGFEIAWTVVGFLNDIGGALDEFPEYPRILGDTGYVPAPDDLFVCAIGETAGRRRVCTKLKARGAQFVNLIQRTACVSPSAALGEGVIIEPFATLGANCRVGDFTTILGHVMISHDAKVGVAAQISPFACILGRASIGDEAMIGSHAVILPNVKVGARATVGAGSVVIKNVPEGATVFGVPAMQIQ